MRLCAPGSYQGWQTLDSVIFGVDHHQHVASSGFFTAVQPRWVMVIGFVELIAMPNELSLTVCRTPSFTIEVT
jgi:hypothetical protein